MTSDYFIAIKCSSIAKEHLLIVQHYTGILGLACMKNGAKKIIFKKDHRAHKEPDYFASGSGSATTTL